MKTSSRCKAPTFAALACLLSIQSASAVVTFNLLAPAANGVGVVSDGGKNVIVLPGSRTVVLDLWVVVTGTDVTGINEALRSTAGGMILSGGPALSIGGISLDAGIPGNTAILSVPTTLRGHLSNPDVHTTGLQEGLIAPWGTAVTSNGGVARDLNGDGFMDVGGTTSISTGNGFISVNAGGSNVNSASGLTPGINFNLLANGVEFRVAEYNFAIPDAVAGTSTGVNYGEALFNTTLNNLARAG